MTDSPTISGRLTPPIPTVVCLHCWALVPEQYADEHQASAHGGQSDDGWEAHAVAFIASLDPKQVEQAALAGASMAESGTASILNAVCKMILGEDV